MRISIGLVFGCALAIVGCDRLKGAASGSGDAASGPAAEGATGAAAAAGATSSAPEAKAATNAKADARAIDGVGDVPAWAPDKKGSKCVVDAAARAKLRPLEKGDDAQIAAGKADVAALAKDLGADTCNSARKALAQALNDGGFARYNKKKYDEANRYWRAALVVRPSNVISRYNLACGLALAGKPKDAVAEIEEIARAARDEDATASNFLEKAKSDEDLKSVRDDAAFKAALGASTAHLVGPRSEPETGAKAVALLPLEFKKAKDQMGVSPDGFVTYKPAVQKVWTWRPDGSTELLVTTIIDDPAKAGKPKGDMNQDYGAIAVWKRDGDALTMLVARKTGESPPSVASGKNNTVSYTFDEPCGTLKGTLKWSGSKVEVHEMKCEDLGM